MPDVPNHLVPTDGLTNSRIRFVGMDAHEDGPGTTMRFDIHDEQDLYIGTISIDAHATAKGTVDAMIAQAYKKLTDMLRQWLYSADRARVAYENKGE